MNVRWVTEPGQITESCDNFANLIRLIKGNIIMLGLNYDL